MCNAPQVFKNSNDMSVPCGKCVKCKSRRVSAWSFRLMEEERRASSSYFITLTYDGKYASRLLTRNGFLGLEPRDLQLFFKRLRKAHSAKFGDVRLKYYAVGEYGGHTKRPHFHILLFNAKLELIDPAWNLGAVHYGEVTGASVGYCLKYISKPSKIPMHRNDDRLAEFSRMSKGLGASYLDQPGMKEWHKADLENRMYLNLTDGKKCSMPRYYKDRLYTDEEREKIAAKALQTNIARLERLESRSLDSVGDFNRRKKAARAAEEMNQSSPTKKIKI